MNLTPYISIVVPCYNASKFLEQTIDSVQQQPFKNWELILVNDGSTDCTEQICSDRSKTDSRIRSIHIENGGAGHARNVGIQSAKGTWILFLDADDLFLTNSINNQLYERLLKLEIEGIEIIYTSIVRGMDLNLRENIRFYRAEQIEAIKYRPNLAFWNGIYRSSFLKRPEISFFEYKEQDIETAFRYIVFVEAKRLVSEPEIAFYFQRENPISNTHTWNLTKLHYIKALVYNELLEKYHKKTNYNYLYEEVIHEIHDFYRCCIRNGIQDLQWKKTINRIYFKRMLNPLGKSVTNVGKRHQITTLAYCTLSNILAGKKTSIEESQKIDLMIDDSQQIMKRLKSVSEYIKTCLLGE